MTYSTNAQVQGLVARVFTSGFGAGTTPTSTQVDTFRTQIAGEINMHLGAVDYVLPITTPSELIDWLSLVESEGVAAMVLKAFAPESVVSENGGPVIPAYAFWESRYQKALKAIDDRTISSASATTLAILPSSYLTEYPANAGNDGSDGFTAAGWGTADQPAFSMQRVF